ncbi:MAG: DUF4080 domain-containing protein [Candidatus Nitronauta litoralis]|uniref:DUF4080 domain-containing protein n=1 Tax=Candidatus Nitronauta litoralis TaxID=2705533 RepID=A0A7T0G1I4_9BACT|nr:MAG: DUF4080 domain-containing protein [Candidatus Nitronauta litoralis]
MQPSIGLITLNAKFIHSSLSLRSLRNAARNAGYHSAWIREFTINQPIWKIAAEVQKQNPDILGISIYIWNRQKSLELIEMLQKQKPEIKIVVGGPEVSFDDEPPAGCTLIAGEGEAKWVEYLGFACEGNLPPANVLERFKTFGTDLPSLAAPYLEEDLPDLRNRYAYIETSRGCPYLCSFCLSALDEKVRYFDEDLIREQLAMLIEAGVRKFKFVDRTFNLNPKRMKRLIKWLSHYEDREFHFEVVGDILSDDMLDFLSSVPKGVFQFEIGVQTLNEDVNSRMDRRQDNARLFSAIKRLVREDRIHIHCDLIFGLPGEGLKDALNSFEEVLQLKPHELQLGFLKFLPGAPIKNLIKEFDYRYLSTPPYEVIANRDMPSNDIIFLKNFDEIFDQFYNSKRFRFTIEHLFQTIKPVDLFSKLLDQRQKRYSMDEHLSLDSQFRLLSDTFELHQSAFTRDLLKLDFLYHRKQFRLPAFMREGVWHLPRNKRTSWEGDRKTPIHTFMHTLHQDEAGVRLKSSEDPVFYALVHPECDSGYFTHPTLHRI